MAFSMITIRILYSEEVIMQKRNGQGFRPIIGYPFGLIKNMRAVPLPERQYWALAKSLDLYPCNKEANFGWSDDYNEKGFYLYQHDDTYALLTINAEDQ